MAFRLLFFYYVIISMIYVCSIESSPISGDFILENDSSSSLVNPSPFIIYPYNFISFICQQQEQYPLKITRKLCSNYLQTDKRQEQEPQQQQRGKRVGWTISV